MKRNKFIYTIKGNLFVAFDFQELLIIFNFLLQFFKFLLLSSEEIQIMICHEFCLLSFASKNKIS